MLLLITVTKISCGEPCLGCLIAPRESKFVSFMDPVVHCRLTGVNFSHGETRFGSQVQRKGNWKALCILPLDLASGSGFAIGF